MGSRAHPKCSVTSSQDPYLNYICPYKVPFMGSVVRSWTRLFWGMPQCPRRLCASAALSTPDCPVLCGGRAWRESPRLGVAGRTSETQLGH